MMVADGRMPKPKRINNRRVWDRHELDAAFAALPSEDGSVGDIVHDPWSEVRA